MSDDWMKRLVESTYANPVVGGVWVYKEDRCSYSHQGNLVFRRGDGKQVTLTEDEFRNQMVPT